MTLHALRTLLRDHPHGHFRLLLPDGNSVPVSFHITEVGHVHKTFIDCGGTLRESHTCLLQVWVGEDFDHRIETGKMAAILEKASTILPDATVLVEFEYEDRVISQYKVVAHDVTPEHVTITLAHKHTECLAPELCGLPAKPKSSRLPALDLYEIGPRKPSCCGPGGC